MTIDPSQSGNVPATQNQWTGSTGLEDFRIEDAIIPRLSIQNKSATFKDNLTNEEFSSMRLIILGLTKQRILWPAKFEEGVNQQPTCKSPDFITGYPDMNPPRGKEFPWQAAGFNPQQFTPNAVGMIELPCANCQLKEWGSHPDPNNNTPWCAEQWTLSVMYDPTAENNFVPAFLTLQKSAIKAIRSYLTSFARAERPAFTAICQVSLVGKSRGSVDYATPEFKHISESDRSKWMMYSEQFDGMRDYLTTPPAPKEDATPEQLSDNSYTVTQQPVQNQPVQNQPVQNQDPWTGQPAQQQPVQQQPVQQTPPPVQQQPVQQTPPPAQQQPTPVQPTEPPPGASQGGSDLPF